MKLTLGFATALLVYATTAHAQSPSVGVRAGINVANLSFSSETEITDAKSITGLVAGVFGTVPLSDVLSFQPEFLFSMQGAKLTDAGDSATIKLDYVQVPLLARFTPVKGSPIAVLVGPSLGFRTRAKLEVPGEADEFSEDFEDEIKRFDVGLVTGIAVEAGRLVLDGRYTWGLMNIVKDTTDPGTAKNRVFSASVGVRF